MAEWIRFKLVRRPYYDRDGNVLESIEGRKNRKGIDEFTGGGKVYPNLGKVSVLERYQEGETLLVLVEGDPKDIDALTDSFPITFRASPKVQKTEPLGFQAKTLSIVEAEKMKKDVFKIALIKPESGVTK